MQRSHGKGNFVGDMLFDKESLWHHKQKLDEIGKADIIVISASFAKVPCKSMHHQRKTEDTR